MPAARQAQALAAQGAVDPDAATAAMLKVLPTRAEGVWLVTANLKMKYLKK